MSALHERGRVVLLKAQIERGRLLVLTELEGCRHADGFGAPVLLTFAEEWRLIEAALDNVEPLPLGAPSRPRPWS